MKKKRKIKQNEPKQINYKDLAYKYKLFSNLMDHTPDVIYFKDKKGKLIMVNQAHARCLGLKPEEIVGKTDFDIFPKKQAERIAKDDMYVLKTGKPIIDKIEMGTRPDGSHNYVTTTKVPRYDDKGKIIGLMGVTRDITHRIQLERLTEEKESIAKKLEALEELNRMKSEFVSGVSHELRTPLAIIKEALMLVFDEVAGPINDKQRETLKRARDNIGRLKNIMDELLDISRIESGRFKLHYSLVNFNDLIEDSLGFFKKLAQDKGLTLDYGLPKEQVNIFMDAERINRVLPNLITNAIKFTEQGGKIKVELKILETKVRVGVIDTGIGIGKQDLPKLFNKFVQVSKIRGLERRGIGLGLSIAKELVERHGGEIWAESRLGVGSKFYFTLPRFYTVSTLENLIRDRINNLLDKGISVYLINLLIVNFKEFKKRIQLGSTKLFKDLKAIIDVTLKEFPHSGREEPQIVIQNYRIGEYSILFPEAAEKEANKICGLLKDKIKRYFIKNRVENVFINLGIMPYPPKAKLRTTQQLLANLYIKKIYIGSEIRRFKRIQYKGNIEILLPENETESSQVVDISVGGICFISERPLKTDAQVKIRLVLPKRKELIYTKGRVTWMKKLEEFPKERLDKYKVGLEFIGLKDKEKRILSKFIKSIST